jgi:hypothetical protein
MKLNENQKTDLIQRLAEQWTQSQDIGELECFFYDAQEAYLSDLEDKELIKIAEDSGLYAED